MMRLGRRTYLLFRAYSRTGKTPSDIYGNPRNEWDIAFVFAAERYAIAQETGDDPEFEQVG